MSGKSTREIKLQGVPAVLTALTATLALAGLWIFMGRLAQEPFSPSMNTLTGVQTEAIGLPSPTPTESSSMGRSALAQESNGLQSDATKLGRLRVGNFTPYPIRLAVLIKRPEQTNNKVIARPNYEPPAHWDFEPGEGSTKGLIISLPNRSLKLKKGDILVAFAQDGSRRYWGPYVVGETPTPNWSLDTSEWQLELQP